LRKQTPSLHQRAGLTGSFHIRLPLSVRMTDKPYASIVAAGEECLRLYGDSASGVGWRRNDAELRYRIMLDLLRSTEDVTLLDFGCGASHFYEFIRRQS
jgi:hypothetical protein